MIYADYDYYCNEYFGNSIKEADFQRLALHASQYIDYITRGRARADIEEVKMCCCALAEQQQTIETAKELARASLSAGAAGGAEVQSETVGSWSRSYRSTGEIAQAVAEIEENGKTAQLDIARRYLTNTGLLYRGGGRCR